jgi:hypothetical protein
MDPEETGYGNVDWIHLAQGKHRWKALVNTVISLQIPQRRRVY